MSRGYVQYSTVGLSENELWIRFFSRQKPGSFHLMFEWTYWTRRAHTQHFAPEGKWIVVFDRLEDAHYRQLSRMCVTGLISQ